MGPTVQAVPPGADVTYCTYLDWYADRDYDIVQSAGYQTKMGHHVVAFGVAANKPPGTAPCTDADMENGTTFLGGGNTESAPLAMPDGVALRLTKGTQVLFQHHWINTSSAPVDGATAVDLTLSDGSKPLAQAGMFLSASTNFTLKAQAQGSATSDCTIQESLNLFMVAGHEHQLGTHVTIDHELADGTINQIYDSGPWVPQFEFDPPRQNYTSEAPLVLGPGDHLITHCDWNNTEDQDITFPKEMCFAVTYYFPSTGSILCMDGAWSHSAPSTL